MTSQNQLGAAQPMPMPALLVTALLPTVAAIIYFSLVVEQAWVAAGYGLTKLFTVAWPWIASRRWRHPEPALSNSTSAGSRPLSVILGTATGVLGLVLVVGLYRGPLQTTFIAAMPQIASKVEQLGIGGHYLAFALLLSFVHSAIEEIYWRWLLFRQLQLRMVPQLAMMSAAAAFASHHFVIIGAFASGLWIVVGGLSVFAAGYLWCWLYQRTGSLVGSWISHVLLDLAIFWIGFDLLHLAG